jgi:hypothetical protein
VGEERGGKETDGCPLSIAKKTLNRYYNATDQSEVYPIAMGMSPIV